MNAPRDSGNTQVSSVLAGDRRVLARLLTQIDDRLPHALATARELAAHAGRAHVVGITGVPGAGKSTLVNALLGHWLARGQRIAVIAVDPASPLTGGAVLGDRVRMGEHGAHPDIFIRSFSTRGELGGLAQSTRAAIDCFDAAGFDRILVETVGAGQSEIAIAKLADTSVVVCPPGLGDDVQAIKAGILEIADILAVSKGDLPLAEDTAQDLREMLTLRRPGGNGTWKTAVLVVRALQNQGIDALLDAVEKHGQTTGYNQRAAAPAVRAAPPSGPLETDAAALARISQCLQHDSFCKTLGITLVDGGLGRATVAMVVDARHINFNGGCHGGATFSLADAAFGLASNSRGGLASGIDAHITYQTGVRAGEQLVARATEVSRSRRLGVYRIDVERVAADGSAPALVSSFTGTVYIK